MKDGENSSGNWSIYDGDCPLCMREVDMLRERKKSYRAIKFVDISSKDYSPEDNHGLDYETGVWSFSLSIIRREMPIKVRVTRSVAAAMRITGRRRGSTARIWDAQARGDDRAVRHCRRRGGDILQCNCTSAPTTEVSSNMGDSDATMADADRCKAMTAEYEGFFLDYSRQQATGETIEKLLK